MNDERSDTGPSFPPPFRKLARALRITSGFTGFSSYRKIHCTFNVAILHGAEQNYIRAIEICRDNIRRAGKSDLHVPGNHGRGGKRAA